jgi:hypothetical protein
MNWQDETRLLDAEAQRGRPAAIEPYAVRIPHAVAADTIIVVDASSAAEARAIAYRVYSIEARLSAQPAPLLAATTQRTPAERKRIRDSLIGSIQTSPSRMG